MHSGFNAWSARQHFVQYNVVKQKRKILLYIYQFFLKLHNSIWILSFWNGNHIAISNEQFINTISNLFLKSLKCTIWNEICAMKQGCVAQYTSLFVITTWHCPKYLALHKMCFSKKPDIRHLWFIYYRKYLESNIKIMVYHKM